MSGSWRSTRASAGVASRGRRLLSGVTILTLVAMLASVAAIGGRPAVTGAQDGARETARIVPETALLYAAVNLDLSSDQMSQLTTVLERSGLAALFGLDEQWGLSDEDWGDLQPFLGGEAAFVLTRIPDDAEQQLEELAGTLTGESDPSAAAEEVVETTPAEGLAVVLRAGDADAAFAKAQELLTESAAEGAVTVETTEYESVEISYAAGSTDGTTEPMAIARVGDYTVLAGVPEDIQPLVDVQAGSVGSLADGEAFNRLAGELSDDFVVWGYLNGAAIRERVAAGGGGESIANLEFVLGDNLALIDGQIGFVFRADQNGLRFETLTIPTGDRPAPNSEVFDSSYDERVPGETLLFVNGVELGQNPIVRALALAFAQGVNGEEAGTVPEGMTSEEYATSQFELAATLLGFNLETDLLAQLTGEFVFSLSVSNLLSPDGMSGVLASTVADPAVVTEVVSDIGLLVASSASESMTVSTREVEGATVNVVDDTSSGLPLHIEYGVVDGQLIIGLGGGLQQAVDGVDESLADNPTYQATMDELPDEHGASAYLDLGQIISFLEFFLASTATSSGVIDSSPDCETYASQEEAQAAYDADPGTLIDLDQDFDGRACEDFFAAGDSTPEAAPDFSAIESIGFVQYSRDGLLGTSTILYIPE